MKIIFLDIDGVLNNEDSDIVYLGEDSVKTGGFFCPELVVHLNTIIQHTGASIVLSSTWRLGLSLQQANKLMGELGIIGDLIGITDSINDRHVFRGNEIYKWIRDNEGLVGKYYDFHDYLILDDDSDMLYWQRNNFVQTNGRKGLTESNVMESIAILNGERGESHGVNEYVMEFIK
ncbi:putative HAD domain-containing protein [Vibrio phage 249E41-1]|nr:putative HAD domain-containing protein [Vibrio phage 249E41-1]